MPNKGQLYLILHTNAYISTASRLKWRNKYVHTPTVIAAHSGSV